MLLDCVTLGLKLFSVQQALFDGEVGSLARNDFIAAAKAAGKAARYSDVLRCLVESNKLLETPADVGVGASERKLLAEALKMLVKPLRNSFSVLSEELARKQDYGLIDGKESGRTLLLREYCDSKCTELSALCLDIVEILSSIFIPLASNAEERIHLNKLAGDYSRYISETFTLNPTKKHTEERTEAIESAIRFYEVALEEARSDLLPTSTLRLNLCLTFAIFCKNVLGDSKRASEIARTGHDDAVAEMGEATETNNLPEKRRVRFKKKAHDDVQPGVEDYPEDEKSEMSARTPQDSDIGESRKILKALSDVLGMWES